MYVPSCMTDLALCSSQAARLRFTEGSVFYVVTMWLLVVSFIKGSIFLDTWDFPERVKDTRTFP